MAAEEPNKKQIQLSWEENVMRVRNEAKLALSNFNDDLFSIFDPFFKLTNQINKQITIIMKENDRLIKILKKNKIDYAPEPPKPLTKDQLPAKTIEEATIPAPKPLTKDQIDQIIDKAVPLPKQKGALPKEKPHA